MKRTHIVALLAAAALAIMHDVSAQKPDAGMRARGRSGNPVIEGWYADPEAIVYGREYLDLSDLVR